MEAKTLINPLNPFEFETKWIGKRCYRINPVKISKQINKIQVKPKQKQEYIFNNLLEKFEKSSSEEESQSFSYSDDDDWDNDLNNQNKNINTKEIEKEKEINTVISTISNTTSNNNKFGNSNQPKFETFKDKSNESAKVKTRIVELNDEYYSKGNLLIQKENNENNEADKNIIKSKISNQENNVNIPSLNNQNLQLTKKISSKINSNIKNNQYSLLLSLAKSDVFTTSFQKLQRLLEEEFFIPPNTPFFSNDNEINIDILNFNTSSQNFLLIIKTLKDIIKIGSSESDDNIEKDFKFKELCLDFELFDFIESHDDKQQSHFIITKPKNISPLKEYYLDFLDFILQNLLDKLYISEDLLISNNYVFDQLAQRYEPKAVSFFIFNSSKDNNEKVNEFYCSLSNTSNDSKDDAKKERCFDLINKGFNSSKIAKKLKTFSGLGICKFNRLLVKDNFSNEIIEEIQLI